MTEGNLKKIVFASIYTLEKYSRFLRSSAPLGPWTSLPAHETKALENYKHLGVWTLHGVLILRFWEIPVVLTNLSKTMEMCHFLVPNRTVSRLCPGLCLGVLAHETSKTMDFGPEIYTCYSFQPNIAFTDIFIQLQGSQVPFKMT